METILVSGGSGLIGRHLCRLLKNQGYQVAVLTRKSLPAGDYLPVHWDPDQGSIPPEAVASAAYIIHLSGAGIGEGRWTKARKEEITGSRIRTARLLSDTLKRHPGRLKAFISASATGYYGAVTRDRVFREEDPPAEDFLGETCRKWEETARPFEELGVRTVMLRTGVVLTPRGGALARMAALTRLGLGSPLGSGRQYMPWIHIDDLCRLYLKALEDPRMSGPYNATAPVHVTNREFFAALAATFRKPLWLPRVPSAMLKLLFGEMASVLLEGSRVSPEKAINAGFHFRFPEPSAALADLLSGTAGKNR